MTLSNVKIADNSFGYRLRKTILNKYNSLSEFSRESGIARDALNHYVSNKRPPNMDKIIIMCELLEVSADYLIFGKGDNVDDKNYMRFHHCGSSCNNNNFHNGVFLSPD